MSFKKQGFENKQLSAIFVELREDFFLVNTTENINLAIAYLNTVERNNTIWSLAKNIKFFILKNVQRLLRNFRSWQKCHV